MRRLISLAIPALVVLPLLALADNDVQKGPVKSTGPTAAKRVESAKTSRGKNTDSKSIPEITQQQEKAVIALVQKHHNDLFEVLVYLKEGLPREYERAIRDLSRTCERLAQFEQRDPKRYQIELRLWQARSTRQLLTARLQMGRDKALLAELRKTLTEEHNLSLEILQHERDRLVRRLEKIGKQIETQEAEVEALVERKFATLTKAAKNSQRKVNSKRDKPAARKKTKDPT